MCWYMYNSRTIVTQEDVWFLCLRHSASVQGFMEHWNRGRSPLSLCKKTLLDFELHKIRKMKVRNPLNGCHHLNCICADLPICERLTWSGWPLKLLRAVMNTCQRGCNCISLIFWMRSGVSTPAKWALQLATELGYRHGFPCYCIKRWQAYTAPIQQLWHSCRYCTLNSVFWPTQLPQVCF